jgi:hypothetical protein
VNIATIANPVRIALVAGVILGLLYTLSPLLVLSVAALGAMTWRVSQSLSGTERRWFIALMAVAIGLRLAFVAGLFLSADPNQPFGTFFGDEQIFKTRPIWLRNLGLGLPISPADVIYAFDETGMSGHLYVLAYLQAVVGDAPYGVHFFNVTLYMASILAVYVVARRSFGRVAAMGGLLILSLFPSLFFWSVSALKEPVYAFLAVVELMAAIAIVRAPSWPLRMVAAAAVVVIGFAMEDIRKGTLAVALLGTVTGLGAATLWARPKLAMLSIVALPIALVLALNQPAVEARVLKVVRDSIRFHTGHVLSDGVAYKIVDGRYYARREEIPHIGRREAAAYVVRSTVSYVVEPSPTNWQSRMLWAYLPEHLLWLLLVALVPVGIAAGLKRDPLVTLLMAAHAVAIVMMVALTSGNIGTLIRHRGTSLTYLAWFAALGAAWLLARAMPARKGSVA